MSRCRREEIPIVSHECLPNLFVPGAQKSGTSSLVSMLERHPEVCVAGSKEPNVFGLVDEERRLNAFKSAFAGRSERWRCDGSAIYFYNPRSAQRIFDLVGDSARFVIVLRRPTDRAFSAYWFSVANQLERRPFGEVFPTLRNLDEFLDREAASVANAVRNQRVTIRDYALRLPDPLVPFRYVYNSCYSTHLKEYLVRFNRTKIKILFSDGLRAEPAQTLRGVCEFLGLRWDSALDTKVEDRQVTQVPRAGLLPAMLRSAKAVFSPGSFGWVGSRVRDAYRPLVYRRPPSAPSEVVASFERLFRPELSRLQDLIGPLPEAWQSGREGEAR